MSDHQIDRLVRQARSYPDRLVVSLDLGGGRQELLEEIMSTSVTPQLVPPDPEGNPESSSDQNSGSDPGLGSDPALVELGVSESPPTRPALPRRHRRMLVGVAAAAAFAAAIAGPTIAFRGSHQVKITPQAQQPQASAAAVQSSVHSDVHLLLNDPAWKIAYLDQTADDNGEIHFTHGSVTLEVTWMPASDYQGYYQDRLDVSKPVPQEALGRKGSQFTYSATDHAVMLPPHGKTFVEIRGGGDTAAFVAEVSKLEEVSEAQWLAAMPSSVVTPDRAGDVAKQMLADVPLPPNFDLAKLPDATPKDYYQYGAAVMGNVTCAWLSDYEKAWKEGDQPGMAKVNAALSTSRHWKVLQTMDKDGDYPEVLWQYADKVAQNQDVADYKQSLGCD